MSVKLKEPTKRTTKYFLIGFLRLLKYGIILTYFFLKVKVYPIVPPLVSLVKPLRAPFDYFYYSFIFKLLVVTLRGA